jgi:D-amino-acid dehydrogenase
VRVVVIGGGLIGLCAAHRLARDGAEVTVVDRGRLGAECSRGNTGWVVPALSAPVSAPGSVRQGLTMTFRRDSPFRIKPRPSTDLGQWLRAFVRSSQRARFGAASRAILALNERTLDLFDELRDSGVKFEMHEGGIVFLCLTEAALAGTQGRFDALGYKGEIERRDGDALRSLEPSVSEAVHGGLHIKPERYVRPETLTAGLRGELARLGVPLVEHAPVTGLRRTGGWVVETATAGGLEAERVVISAGIWSRRIAAGLGLRLPMQPGKGHSVTGQGTGIPPANALFFTEAMVGAAPYDGGVRLAGMLELAGMNGSVDNRRIDLLRRAARRYLSGWDPGHDGEPWAGLRPLPPDGLPIIGPVPGRDGAFVATGHGMVGLTLAPATAALLAPLVLEGRLPPELAPFSPDRF